MNPIEASAPFSGGADVRANKASYWTVIGWRLGVYAPEVVKRGMRLGTKFALACLNRRLPVAWLRGPARPSGQQATLLVAGQGLSVDYLSKRFFAAEPQREPVAHISIWALPGLLQQLQSSADLTIARVDQFSAHLFFDANYLSVPEWVGSWLKIPKDPFSLARAGDNVRADMRRIRRNQLQSVISHGKADFNEFYYTMYVPYVRNRYGDLAFLRELSYFLRFCSRTISDSAC